MSAVMSTDLRYRYRLSRRWDDDGNNTALFVMLNPSTADHELDDRTITRCIGFAKRLGCTGLDVVNLYALRSTKPEGLWLVDDPIGEENDHYLRLHIEMAARRGEPIIAAWGANAKQERADHVLAFDGMQTASAFGFTKFGAPLHPLYQRADRPLIPLIATSPPSPGIETP